jgi:hypothetical protein
VDDPRSSGPGVAAVRRTAPELTVDVPAGDLFTILWEALADVLGTAAAATLLRRAAKRALPRWPELKDLAFTRDSLEHRYIVPVTWREPTPGPPQALCALVQELWGLLIDLTGRVVVDRLARIPELRERNIVPPGEGRA